MKVRLKETQFEAIEYRGDNGEEVDLFMQERGADPQVIPGWRQPIVIKRRDTWVAAWPGDWILFRAGEFVPLRAELFHQIFEVVGSGALLKTYKAVK